ncbi:MAG: class I SAM-dependent methyltransferase [Acidimicrobiia bacterium]|nr:class I SAM-dependent methyltransferase [Acidimicrobiia bacterium]
MSSPIAARRRTVADRALIGVHRKASHHRRLEILAGTLAPLIDGRRPPGAGRLLDIGCGDLGLVRALAERLDGLDWQGADIHELPDELAGVEPWTHYRSFDGARLPFEDAAFDVGLFADVLHHVPAHQLEALVRDALRVCPVLVVKDHFEYGRWSRQCLRAMDVVGNRGYGVSVPERYFTKGGFGRLMDAVGARCAELRVGVELYGHLPVVRRVARADWQFVAVLERRDRAQ